jgi:hypothetical protein
MELMKGRLTVMEILVSSFIANDKKTTDGDIERDRCGTDPPGESVSDKINMSMIFDPEVLE